MYKHYTNPESLKYLDRRMGEYFPVYDKDTYLTPIEERGGEAILTPLKTRPILTNMYELEALSKEYLLGNRITDICRKYNISRDTLKPIREALDSHYSPRLPRSHFTYLLQCPGEYIVKPDFRLQWPFNPCGMSGLTLGPSYSFYRIPDLIGKGGGNVYYDTYNMRLVDGVLLEWVMYADPEEIAHIFGPAFENFSHPLLGRYKKISLGKLTLEQVKYIAFYLLDMPGISDSDLSMLGETADRHERYSNSKMSFSPGALSSNVWCSRFGLNLDSPTIPYSGSDYHSFKNASLPPHVKLYKNVWIEEYIKRTMWDHPTEHSLMVFDSSLDSKREHYGYYHRMPAKILKILHESGIKQDNGLPANPAFDYALSVFNGQLVPFKENATIYRNYDGVTITANYNCIKLSRYEEEFIVDTYNRENRY